MPTFANGAMAVHKQASGRLEVLPLPAWPFS